MRESAIQTAPVLSKTYECPLPDHYYLDTGNICNLRCPFCFTGLERSELSKGFLSKETFDVIFDQIRPHAKVVGMYNWGEPFLNENLLHFASVFSRHGIHSQIDSNLTLRDFTDEDAAAIVRSGLSQIFASIDGASQTTYEKYRVGGRIDRALGNLSRIVRAKERLRSSTPDVGWNFLINKFNEHEIDKAREMARDMGVAIEFKLMSCWDESWKSSFHRAEEARASGAPEQIGVNARPLPVALEKLQLHPRLREWCSQPFAFMVINWDGNVMPCCSVFGDEYTLGNLLEESIEDVWNNAKLRACRKFLYNYGPRQNTGSVCETMPCPVALKYSNGLPPTA
jgi:radical SAM protein with 4Fe4S-binding SPASM domain